MAVFRPADGNETAGSYLEAVFRRTSAPSMLCLSRQDLPVLPGSSAEKVRCGGYALSVERADAPLSLVLLATGSEVSICVDAAAVLAKEGGHNVRVVSMPCCEVFEQQSADYRRAVLPANVPVFAVEAANPLGWDRYAHHVHGMKTFGASGPYKQLYAKYGLTVENIAKVALDVIAYYQQRPIPDLIDRLD